MTWTCEKCGKRHDVIENVEACRREQRKIKLIVLVMFVGVILIMLGADVAWNSYVYGDWTCAFAKCRKVKVVP